MSENKKHPFEHAGYAHPYNLIGSVEAWHDPLEGSLWNDGSARKPAGSCDVCGTCFGSGAQFVDSAGKVFQTGFRCAEKAFLNFGEVEIAGKLDQLARNATSEFQAQKRKVRNAKRAEEARIAREKVEADLEVAYNAIDLAPLEEIAHPLEFRAIKGDSWADAVRYFLDAGNIRKACRVAEDGLEAALAGDADPVLRLPTVADSQHVGEIKKRAEFAATLIGAFHFETQFGMQSIYKFADDAGNALAWKTSGCLGDFEIGDRLKFKATPKEHSKDRYNEDRPITWITRLKVL